ncbi:MAG: SH3 domain-containing protein, partial [Chlamydiales bacterium]|nr:SH3 domain-containing protein [Chlamydiales bacterium]
MRLWILLLSFSCTLSMAIADEQEQMQPQTHTPKRFESFTGKISGHNVRMRLQPNLDAQVYKELDKDDLVLVTGLVDDFYACMPPKGLKGYIFRTYVLDGVVEGTNVFVRLGPDRTSPSVAQLNSGDVVKGTIAPQNNKWLQIDIPEDVRFYVAKDYVQKAGDASYFAKQESKRQDANKKLNDLEIALDKELEKPFHKIQLAGISSQLTQFIKDHKDMPQLVAQAETLISHMQQLYLTRGVAVNDEEPQVKAAPKVEKEVEKTKEATTIAPATITPPAPAKPVAILSWQEQEKAFIDGLIQSGKAQSAESFYTSEMQKGNTLHGTIKPYNSFVSTRPGDFVLLNLKTNLPIAYLYSTKTDLSRWINKPVTLLVSDR